MRVRKTYYAQSCIAGKNVYLHRFITDAPKGTEVDHCNDDGLDNRKSNLRIVTHQQNLCRARQATGRSGFRGVTHSTKHPAKPWRARIKSRGKEYSLGHFHTPEEAARAYDETATCLFGEFARRNFD